MEIGQVYISGQFTYTKIQMVNNIRIDSPLQKESGKC